MNTQKASTKPSSSPEADQATARLARSAIVWSADPTEREWERSLFLVTQRLSEARRGISAGRGVGGLFLASLLGAAVLVGDARGDALPSSESAVSETQETSNDYWAWLQGWIIGGNHTDSQKSGSSSNDPEGGED